MTVLNVCSTFIHTEITCISFQVEREISANQFNKDNTRCRTEVHCDYILITNM